MQTNDFKFNCPQQSPKTTFSNVVESAIRAKRSSRPLSNRPRGASFYNLRMESQSGINMGHFAEYKVCMHAFAKRFLTVYLSKQFKAINVAVSELVVTKSTKPSDIAALHTLHHLLGPEAMHQNG